MALLLVVSLLALVTLLVVSLAVLTRVETQISSTVTARAQARQNALLALDVAVGRLQMLVGPDQRVTGTAQLLGATGNPHWTGVWRTDFAGNIPEGWLVSGGGADPASAPTGDRRETLLVGAFTTAAGENGAVTVPVELLTDTNVLGYAGERVTGAFGYFVSDEGVKATLSANRAPGYDPDSPVSQRAPLMGGTYAVGFDDVVGFDVTASAVQSALATVETANQFVSLSEAIDAAAGRAHGHDYTAGSRGVLVDSPRGRLKSDLSTDGATAIPGLNAFTDLMTETRRNALSPVYPIRAGSLTGGALTDVIAPIITQVGLQFSVHTISATSRTLETRLRFFVELANPFSSALEAEPLLLVVSGLPGNIGIESQTRGTTENHGGATINLEDLYALHTASDGSPAIEFDLPFDEPTWAPGRVITWRNQSGDTRGEAANRELVFDASTRTSYWEERPGVALDGPDALHSGSPLNSELRFTGADDWEIRLELQRQNGAILATHTLPLFYAVDTAWLDANSTIPDFGMLAQLVDRSGNQDDEGASSWIVQGLPGDLRRRDFDETYWTTNDPESASYNTAFSGPNSAVEARQLFNRDPVDRDYLSYYQPSYNSDVALYELPRQPWQSVGSLQHLAFTSGPTYNVGNSWSEHNDWFDRFLFSGELPLSSDTPPSHLEPIVRAPVADVTAAGWWARDQFNLNSTNAAAWTAVLLGLASGGLDYRFDFTTHDHATGAIAGVDDQTMRRPVGRFSQSVGEMWDVSVHPENFQAPLRQYRRGARALSVAQVRGLAAEIASNVQRRGLTAGPFRSVEEFLAPGAALFGGLNLIEYSIEQYDASVPESGRINWDQYFPDTPMKIDAAAPAFVTSADVMTALAPMVNVRSDTFVVRTYGEVVTPTTVADFASSTPVARAWLEAVVQRFPDGVDTDDFTSGETSPWTQMIADPKWGRRCRVLSVRWLNEDEL
ncbi:hypothetical protein [Synoicihabitans lomoniglobus]|uniref:Uncharacterized protein n=1 Tax=Synoicihabitans lomoniglobus TaxID=2909285 RepID=A0AAF0CSB5_9BACT|nr:hypothetical protein [Opitutaceae bacterium LMO-M01]WED67114.1 hypothetical protein PXH66_09650 [Opitutaceae bacterium LMO-M01]